jgi:hypothetical protein
VSGLARLQREFLDAVASGDSPDPGRDVYRANLLANAHSALAAAYPVVRRLVGDAFFRELSDRFTLAHPSRSGDLHLYGSGLSAFLARYAPARELAYLPDVATLEWSIATAYHAADARGMDYAALAAIPEGDRGNLCLRLQPAARLVASTHPVLAIWEANQPERDGTPDRLDGPDFVLVHRDGFAVRARLLAPAEWEFLNALHAGRTLAQIAADPSLADALASEMVRWARLGVIDGFAPCPPRA